MRDYSEDALIEQPAIALFRQLRWETANCYRETWRPGGGSLGRETPAEVVLVRRLRAALARPARQGGSQRSGGGWRG